MISNHLPATATAHDRSYAYSPCYGTCPEDGTLAVSETTGTRVVKHVTRTYAVEEQPAGGYPGRVFLLAKLAHKGDEATKAGQAGMARTGEVYSVSVPAGTAPLLCTCTAGHTHKKCVHGEVMADLVALGLPDPREAGTDRPAASREFDDADAQEAEYAARAARTRRLLAEARAQNARAAALLAR